MRVNFKELADSMKLEENRNSLPSECSAAKYLKTCEGISDENLETFYEAGRFLRNACVNSNRNQNLILSWDIMDDFVNILSKLIDPLVLIQKRELREKCQNVCIQFLGNLIVQNNSAKDEVWKKVSPILFSLLSNLNDQGKDYLCMVIYNCLKSRERIFEEEEEFWLLTSIIDHCIAYNNSEWGVYILQLIVNSKSFNFLYKQLIDYPEYRLFVLDVLIVEIERSEILEVNLEYLSENFESKSTCIMMLPPQNDDQRYQEECNLLLKTLTVLCEATSFAKRYNSLCSRTSLIKCVLGLLKSVESAENASAALGFRRDLIRIVGNMSFQNQKIQNQVREFGGIPLILNACNIDEQNPLLVQWAIFAVRNICEGNRANQETIRSLETQGLATNEFLTNNHVQVKLVDGRVKMSPMD